jgi:cell division protein FtsQ
MLRKIVKLAGYLFLAAFLVVTLAFSARENRNVTCRNIQIELREDETIRISKDEIIRLVNAADKQLVGKELRLIDTELIEREVEKHQAIHRADVYKVVTRDSTSYRGVLGIRIRHREPVLRIMSHGGNYYLDKYGEKIPVSTSYSANVLVATGNFSEEYARQELLPFVKFIDDNPFWKAQLKQIHIDGKSEILLTPLVGDQIIELGSLKDFPEKLRNMKAFYEQVLVQNNWDKYKVISVKDKNQVIAKKR